MKKIIVCVGMVLSLAASSGAGGFSIVTSFEDAASLYLAARGEMARMTPPSLPLDVEDIVEGMEMDMPH